METSAGRALALAVGMLTGTAQGAEGDTGLDHLAAKSWVFEDANAAYAMAMDPANPPCLWIRKIAEAEDRAVRRVEALGWAATPKDIVDAVTAEMLMAGRWARFAAVAAEGGRHCSPHDASARRAVEGLTQRVP